MDYKYAAQLKAEELAEERGLDWKDLPIDERCDLYQEGLDDVFDDMTSAADKD